MKTITKALALTAAIAVSLSLASCKKSQNEETETVSDVISEVSETLKAETTNADTTAEIVVTDTQEESTVADNSEIDSAIANAKKFLNETENDTNQDNGFVYSYHGKATVNGKECIIIRLSQKTDKEDVRLLCGYLAVDEEGNVTNYKED